MSLILDASGRIESLGNLRSVNDDHDSGSIKSSTSISAYNRQVSIHTSSSIRSVGRAESDATELSRFSQTAPLVTVATTVQPSIKTTSSTVLPVFTSAATSQTHRENLPGATPTKATTAAGASEHSATVEWPHIGDITYYDVSAGLNSCNIPVVDSQDIVALSAEVMANGANPNLNPKCGRTIEISYGGSIHPAKIVDTCPSCLGGDLDLTSGLFNKVAPNGDGRVHGVSWRFVE